MSASESQSLMRLPPTCAHFVAMVTDPLLFLRQHEVLAALFLPIAIFLQ